MPKNKESKLRLVPVSEVPRPTRASPYLDLVDEFSKSSLQHAKLEGAKAGAAISVKKAVAKLGLENVAVMTVKGEVYLSKE
jgi:hypothetical protein